MIFYRVVRRLVHVLLYGWMRPNVEGKGNVPEKGPFILLTNHQSYLDPLLVNAVCPRLVFSMTKSTQFAKPLVRRFLTRVGGFPTRRYRVDPQAVRMALRFLDQGRGVGIFPEGERSWDGRLQPLRLGTIRLLLKAGVPVIPSGVIGSYEVWPRWGGFRWWRIGWRRPRVTIRFAEPLDFGTHDDRADREALLDRTLETITNALEEVSRA